MTLITGTSVAQIITIVATPILVRLYSPEDFGVLAIFLALSNIIGALSTGQYEYAICLPERDDDAKHIFLLGLIISACISLLAFFGIVIWNSRFSEFLNTDKLSWWIYFIPIVSFMIGLFNLLNYLNTRLGTFKEVAQVRILRSVATATIQLSAGFFSSGIYGLLGGSAVGNFVGNTKLFRAVNKRYDLFRGYNTKDVVRLGKKYSDFPKITTFSELVNTFQQNISSVIIPILFSTGVLGYYSLAQRILGVPTSLVGDSIRQVFLRAATTARQIRGEALKEFDMAVKSLALMAIPAFTLLFFIVVPVFSLIFGKEWEEAGIYAKILIPYFAVTFISANMSTVMIVFEKQRQMMNIKLAQLVLLATLYGFVKYTGAGMKEYLTLFCIMSSMGNLVFLMYFRNVSKGKRV